VLRWQEEVHRPGIYDLQLDTSVLTPEECAARIGELLTSGAANPSALVRLGHLP